MKLVDNKHAFRDSQLFLLMKTGAEELVPMADEVEDHDRGDGRPAAAATYFVLMQIIMPALFAISVPMGGLFPQ